MKCKYMVRVCPREYWSVSTRIRGPVLWSTVGARQAHRTRKVKGEKLVNPWDNQTMRNMYPIRTDWNNSTLEEFAANDKSLAVIIKEQFHWQGDGRQEVLKGGKGQKYKER